MGVVIGLIVLLVSIGFVVLMMVSEWSDSKSASSGALELKPLPCQGSARKPLPRRKKKKKK